MEDPDCIFCKIVAGDLPAQIVASDERTISFMDINPATPGHALVIPRTHTRDLSSIDPSDLQAVVLSAQRLAGLLQERLGAQGVNLLNSCGAVAWQTVSCTVLLPDKGAIMGALAPVITPTVAGERRCLTLFLEPIARHRADRMVGTEAMSADLAAEVRRKSGFAIRATQRRDAARVQGQDVRLADGRALVRAAVAAAVTVPDSWPNTDYGRRLEAAITTSGFTPLRLDLAQDTGFAAACIPLGVGLPRRRGTR